jgi:zinc protease
MFIPSDKTQKTEIPETPDLAKLFDGYKGRSEIASGETFDVSPANIDARAKRLTLPQGVKAVVLPKKTRGETVNLKLTLRYGNLDSLKGYETAADLLPELMLRGTKSLSRQQVEDELDKNNATVHASGDTGAVTFSVQTKRANLPAVLNLLKQVLREPTLPDDEFEILRRQNLSSAEEQLTDPQMLAIVRVRRAVSPYPKDDVRYVPTVSEEIDRFKSVTVERVKKLYGEFLSSQAGECAIVGDFDVDANLKILREALAGWSSEQSYSRIPRKTFADAKGGREQINTPDKANAVYVAGEVFAMKDSDPDYPAMVMGNYVLGAGTLSSRLGDRVRQKEGLSYGVRSFISSDAFDPRTSLTINAICNPKNMEKVNVAIAEELAALLDKGPTEAELQRAQQGYLQQLRVSWTSDATLASILADTLYVERTMDFYARLEKAINALTPDQVLAALKKYVDPQRLFVVNAGDFAGEASAAK